MYKLLAILLINKIQLTTWLLRIWLIMYSMSFEILSFQMKYKLCGVFVLTVTSKETSKLIMQPILWGKSWKPKEYGAWKRYSDTMTGCTAYQVASGCFHWETWTKKRTWLYSFAFPPTPNELTLFSDEYKNSRLLKDDITKPYSKRKLR